MSDEKLPEWLNGAISLGSRHWFRWWEVDGVENRNGAHVPHRKPDGELCIGGVNFSPLGWKLESTEPLTISPSLLCSCGDHGFIREGKWVPA